MPRDLRLLCLSVSSTGLPPLRSLSTVSMGMCEAMLAGMRKVEGCVEEVCNWEAPKGRAALLLLWLAVAGLPTLSKS